MRVWKRRVATSLWRDVLQARLGSLNPPTSLPPPYLLWPSRTVVISGMSDRVHIFAPYHWKHPMIS